MALDKFTDIVNTAKNAAARAAKATTDFASKASEVTQAKVTETSQKIKEAVDDGKLTDVANSAKHAAVRAAKSTAEFASKASEVVVESAVEAKALAAETSQKVKDTIDDITETLPIKELPKVLGNQALYAVLDQMDHNELARLFEGPLRMDDKRGKDVADNASDTGLRNHVAAELLSAAKNSMALWKELPPYDEIVRLVAKQVKVIDDKSEAEVADVERAILFKIVDLSISKMTEEEIQKMTVQVEQELASRGVYRKVSVKEIREFTTFMAMEFADRAGSYAAVGGLAGTLLGMNSLQLIVLKGIVATSGYATAGGALLGLGASGTILNLAGLVGPIGLALAAMYGSYAAAGPAFRKLIPSICVIAAKRIEIAASQPLQPDASTPQQQPSSPAPQ
jgi:uncharacterized protein YaaW (UPF0174 family)